MVILFFFIFGISIGSFLNVVILRVFLNDANKLDTNILTSHSVCDSCGHILAWYDLIPLLSYLFLRGKCRYCQKTIVVQHTIVEFFSGLLFAAYGYFIFSPRLFDLSLIFLFYTVYSLLVISVLILIFVIDLNKYIIPNKLIFPLIGSAVFLEPLWAVLGFKHTSIQIYAILRDFYWGVRLTYEAFVSTSFPYSFSFSLDALPVYFSPLIAALGAGLFFYFIVFVTKGKGMGMGDVKFAFFMGLFLGMKNVVVAIYLAFIMGAVVSLLLILKKKKTLRQVVPFGPFLITGVFISWFLSEKLLLLYNTVISHWILF